MIKSLVYLVNKELLTHCTIHWTMIYGIYIIIFWGDFSDNNKILFLQKKGIRIMAGAQERVSHRRL